MTRPALIAATAAMVVGAAGLAVATASDAREAVCPLRGAEKLASFELERARDYRVALPRMGISPELDVDDRAYFVLYKGAIDLPVFGPPGAKNQPRERTGVVCVVVNGEAILYADVDVSDSPVLRELGIGE